MGDNYKDYVPYEKASKREKRKRDKEKRNVWDIPPVTQVIPDKKKKKSREKRRRDNYYDDDYGEYDEFY